MRWILILQIADFLRYSNNAVRNSWKNAHRVNDLFYKSLSIKFGCKIDPGTIFSDRRPLSSGKNILQTQ